MRWLLAALPLALAACGPGESRPALMAPPMQAMAVRHAGSLSVAASGGCEACGPGQARLSATHFQQAAELALRQSGLFTAVVPPPAGHDLALRIFRADAPVIGFDMRCTMEVGWTLTRPGQAEPVWQQALETSHTATMADAFAGVERVRLCWEGAARANLVAGLGHLARLPLPPR